MNKLLVISNCSVGSAQIYIVRFEVYSSQQADFNVAFLYDATYNFYSTDIT